MGWPDSSSFCQVLSGGSQKSIDDKKKGLSSFPSLEIRPAKKHRGREVWGLIGAAHRALTREGVANGMLPHRPPPPSADVTVLAWAHPGRPDLVASQGSICRYRSVLFGCDGLQRSNPLLSAAPPKKSWRPRSRMPDGGRVLGAESFTPARLILGCRNRACTVPCK